MSVDKTTLDDFDSFEDMMKQHRGVVKSLIAKDGYYKNTEAVEINNGIGKQLNFMKVMLEYFKLLGTKPTKKDLFLKWSVWNVLKRMGGNKV